jgi:hypothetical protein
MPKYKYPTSNAETSLRRQQAEPATASFDRSASKKAVDLESSQSAGNDVTEPLTGKRTPFVTCTRPQYAAAVAVLQLLTSELWIESLKPFGGLRARCPALATLGIDSDAALLASLHEQLRPEIVKSRDELCAWTAALKQCVRVAFEKLLEASQEGWLSPLAFDRDGNTVIHIAMRCWDARALRFLDGQVRPYRVRVQHRLSANLTVAVQRDVQ